MKTLKLKGYHREVLRTTWQGTLTRVVIFWRETQHVVCSNSKFGGRSNIHVAVSFGGRHKGFGGRPQYPYPARPPILPYLSTPYSTLIPSIPITITHHHHCHGQLSVACRYKDDNADTVAGTIVCIRHIKFSLAFTGTKRCNFCECRRRHSCRSAEKAASQVDDDDDARGVAISNKIMDVRPGRIAHFFITQPRATYLIHVDHNIDRVTSTHVKSEGTILANNYIRNAHVGPTCRHGIIRLNPIICICIYISLENRFMDYNCGNPSVEGGEISKYIQIQRTNERLFLGHFRGRWIDSCSSRGVCFTSTIFSNENECERSDHYTHSWYVIWKCTVGYNSRYVDTAGELFRRWKRAGGVAIGTRGKRLGSSPACCARSG